MTTTALLERPTTGALPIELLNAIDEIMSQSSSTGVEITQKELSLKEIRALKRRLALYRQGDVYHVDISILMGRGSTMSINLSSLKNIPASVKQNLRNASISNPVIEIVSKLKTLRKDLNNEKAKLLRKAKVVRHGSYWLCGQNNMEALQEGIRNLQVMVYEEKQLLLNNYRAELNSFLHRMSNILIECSSSTEEAIESLKAIVKNRFPSAQEMANRINVFVSLEKLPSLAEAAKEDAEIAKAELEFAKAQSEIDLYAQQQEQAKQLFEQDVLNARTILLRVLGQHLDAVSSSLKAQDLNDKNVRKEYQKVVRQLRKLTTSEADNNILGQLTDLYKTSKKRNVNSPELFDVEQTQLNVKLENLQKLLQEERVSLSKALSEKAGLETARLENFSF